jgi:hypothetical protein
MAEKNRTIEELSLEYFLNKDAYGKYLEKNTSEKQREYRKDKRFYRKRIYDLTKTLINCDENESQKYNKDLLLAFNMYSRVCIEYFKNLDKTDIIQEDYIDLLNSNIEIAIDPVLNIDSINSVEQADQLLMRSIKITEPNSLEKLLKRKSTQNVKKEVLPIEKNIDLKDPNLKKKGIKVKEKEKEKEKEKDKEKNKEKNNLSNIYDEEGNKDKKTK